MNTWFRKVGMGAMALTLAGVLGGCNNGSGGGGLIRLFFGINGSGSCSTVVVDVNLEEAGAEIARDENGAVQCVLNAVLDSNGCDISFSELENGDLRAIITGCTIPAVTNLFSCLFEDVDISELQDTATAQCTCTTQNCDGTPPVCISLEPDPRSCEICDNDEDDDGNGLVDCEDPNCENAPECNGTTTTSTTSTTGPPDTTSTTNTTTTTVSTTTSTTEEQFNCKVIFRLADDLTVGALQWETDYSNAPGGFLGTGEDVECASLVEGNDELGSFNDVDSEDLLISGLISVDGFAGPVNVSECTFRSSIVPLKADFAITVTEAAEPDLDPISPLPDVVIQSIDCDRPSTTTTTLDVGTTTTTEEGPTTTMGGTPQNYCINWSVETKTHKCNLEKTEVCTTNADCPAFACTAGPTPGNTCSTNGDCGSGGTCTKDSCQLRVGALQWKTDYSDAPGGFEGSADTAACGSDINGLFAANDDEPTEKVTLGVISSVGFVVPNEIGRCTFNGFSNDPPVPGDFPFVIEDQTDKNGSPITVTLSVTVNEEACLFE